MASIIENMEDDDDATTSKPRKRNREVTNDDELTGVPQHLPVNPMAPPVGKRQKKGAIPPSMTVPPRMALHPPTPVQVQPSGLATTGPTPGSTTAGPTRSAVSTPAPVRSAIPAAAQAPTRSAVSTPAPILSAVPAVAQAPTRPAVPAQAHIALPHSTSQNSSRDVPAHQSAGSPDVPMADVDMDVDQAVQNGL